MDFMAENRHKSEETDNQIVNNTRYYLTKYDLRLGFFTEKGYDDIVLPQYSAVAVNNTTFELSSDSIDIQRKWYDEKISFINSRDVPGYSYEISKEQYEHFRALERCVADEEYQRSREVDKIWEGGESDDVKKAQKVKDLSRAPYPEKTARENELKQFLQKKGVKLEQTRFSALRNISISDQETDMTQKTDTDLAYT